MSSETAYDPPSLTLLPLILELQKGDALAVDVSRRLKDEVSAGDAMWSVDNQGLVRHRGRAYVPLDGSVRAEIMKICHDDPLAGHFGQRKTLTLIQRKYWWPKMAKDIQEYVSGCDVCQRVKAPRYKKTGEMSGLPLPRGPFKSISMDFITDLPPSRDPLTGTVYNSVLVIVDRYTKVSRYIPCNKTIDALELAQLFTRYWVKDFGIPRDIILDRGSVFTSNF